MLSKLKRCKTRYQGTAKKEGAGPFLLKTCPSGPKAPSTSPGLFTHCVQAMAFVSTSPRSASDSVTANMLTSSMI